MNTLIGSAKKSKKSKIYAVNLITREENLVATVERPGDALTFLTALVKENKTRNLGYIIK